MLSLGDDHCDREVLQKTEKILLRNTKRVCDDGEKSNANGPPFLTSSRDSNWIIWHFYRWCPESEWKLRSRLNFKAWSRRGLVLELFDTFLLLNFQLILEPLFCSFVNVTELSNGLRLFAINLTLFCHCFGISSWQWTPRTAARRCLNDVK